MKKLIPVVLLVAVMLVGCSRTGGIQEAAAARDECHDLKGIFTMWTIPEIDGYGWECDLSDEESE